MCQFIEKGDEHISRISLSDKKDGTEDEAEDLTSSSARRREESHRTAALSWGFQVDRLPSHPTVRIGVGPVDGSSPGSVKPPVLLYSVIIGRSELFLPRGLRQTSADTDSELLSLRTSPGGCCLIRQRALCFQRGRTLTVTLILILEPPVSGARRHWGRNHWADIDIHICAVFGDKCVELPL